MKPALPKSSLVVAARAILIGLMIAWPTVVFVLDAWIPWSIQTFSIIHWSIVAAGVLAFVAVLLAHRLDKQYIKSLNYCLCPNCRYDLRTLPTSGTCPECGQQYELENIKIVWRDYTT